MSEVVVRTEVWHRKEPVIKAVVRRQNGTFIGKVTNRTKEFKVK